MKQSILIADNNYKKEIPNYKDYLIIRWDGSINNLEGNEIDILNHIEVNSDKYRESYINIIYDIFNQKYRKKRLFKYLDLAHDINLFDSTFTLHKDNIYKSDYIIEVLKFIALEDILKGCEIKKIVSLINSNRVNKVFKEYSLKKKIKYKEKVSTCIMIIKELINFIINSKFILISSSLIWLIKEFVISIIFSNKKSFSKIKDYKNIFIDYFGKSNIKNDSKMFDSNQYWGNLPSKLYDKNLKSLFIHHNLYNVSPFKSKRFIQKLNKQSSLSHHIMVNSFLKLGTFLEIIYDFFKIIKKSIFINFNSINKSTNFNYFYLFDQDIKKDLYGIYLMKNILNFNIFNEFYLRLNTDSKIFYLMENHPWENSLLKAGEINGFSRSYGYIHTPIRYWDLRYFFDFREIYKPFFNQNLPNYILVSDLVSKEYLESNDNLKSRIIEVEALRFLDIENYRNFDTNFDSTPEYKILIFADYDIKFSEFILDLFWGTEFYKKNYKNLSITLKEHPAKLGLLSKLVPSNIKITNDDNYSLMKQNDIIIAPYSSSVALNAYYSGKNYFLCSSHSSLNYSIFRNPYVFNIGRNSRDFDVFFGSIVNGTLENKKKIHIFNINYDLNSWIKLFIN